MRVFKSIPPDALNQIREQIRSAELPTVQALEQAALLINKSADYQDALKSGLVPRLTGDDLMAFVERVRRDRQLVDASRRTNDKQAKRPSQLQADQAEGTSDELLSELFNDFMHERSAWQHMGAGLATLGDIAAEAIAGGAQVTEIAAWLRAQRHDYAPANPNMRDGIRSDRSKLEASLAA